LRELCCIKNQKYPARLLIFGAYSGNFIAFSKYALLFGSVLAKNNRCEKKMGVAVVYEAKSENFSFPVFCIKNNDFLLNR